MCNSTGNQIFLDFQSQLSRVARFPTTGQKRQRLWVWGCLSLRFWNKVLASQWVSDFTICHPFLYFHLFLYLNNNLYKVTFLCVAFNLYTRKIYSQYVVLYIRGAWRGKNGNWDLLIFNWEREFGSLGLWDWESETNKWQCDWYLGKKWEIGWEMGFGQHLGREIRCIPPLFSGPS